MLCGFTANNLIKNTIAVKFWTHHPQPPLHPPLLQGMLTPFAFEMKEFNRTALELRAGEVTKVQSDLGRSPSPSEPLGPWTV